MSDCKHRRVNSVAECALFVCDECGDTEYDIVMAKSKMLYAENAQMKTVIEEARVIFGEYVNGRVRTSPFVEDKLITMGQHIKALDNIGRAGK